MLTSELIQLILDQHPLPQTSIHSVAHWARVLENGRRLAEKTGANLVIVEFFAVLHASRRFTDGFDPGHGKRGAKYAITIREHLNSISDHDFKLLQYACKHHSKGKTEGDVTVQTCWDADRLDLPRAGISIKPGRLCTNAAKERTTIQWATDRSTNRIVPDLVRDEWHHKIQRD